MFHIYLYDIKELGEIEYYIDFPGITNKDTAT